MTSGPQSPGIHHITAITGDGRKNIAFYTALLGLRLVKRTVNFDDPGAHHLYYGDETGSPGTILTFFAWDGASPGKAGNGEATTIAFRIPSGTLDWWAARLAEKGIAATHGTRFGDSLLQLEDPDGIAIELVATAALPGAAKAWAGAGIAPDQAITGFHGATLQVADGTGTAQVLTQALGFEPKAQEGAWSRFVVKGRTPGGIIDVKAAGSATPGRLGTGSVHHVAFRAADDADQEGIAEALRRLRVGTTEQKDRTYFRSIYFREPGGVILEIATDGPGFASDESVESLGSTLKLPPQYERLRGKIEAALPPLD
jgi:glyoxalase family protein